MNRLYYILNELIKSYHVYCSFDKKKANEILAKINEYRLQIVLLAEQRQIFIEQLDIPANATGYPQDVFFTPDDVNSLVIKMIGFLEATTTITLTQQGIRENYFTREPVRWQELMSQTQDGSLLGQQIPFDFNQEIYLEKNQALAIGVAKQTTAGFIFVHGCNLKDDVSPNKADLIAEINSIGSDGKPNLPKPQLVPIQFQFTVMAVDNHAVAVDGGREILSIKSDESVILTEVSTTSINSRITLLDRGRDQEICNEVESLGIAGSFTNPFTTYYPLPYPHLLRSQDRLQLRGLNGSLITGHADTTGVQTLCFRGFTI